MLRKFASNRKASGIQKSTVECFISSYPCCITSQEMKGQSV